MSRPDRILLKQFRQEKMYLGVIMMVMLRRVTQTYLEPKSTRLANELNKR